MLSMGIVWYERKRDQKFLQERREVFDEYVRTQQETFSSLDIIQALEYIMRYLALQVSQVVIALLHFLARKVEYYLRKVRRRISAAAKPQEEPSSFVRAMKEKIEE